MEIFSCGILDLNKHVAKADMENYRYWKDGDLDIRTCIGCKVSEVQTPDGTWVMYVTQELLEYCLLHDANHLTCPNCEDEWQKEADKYRAKHFYIEAQKAYHKSYNLCRKMLEMNLLAQINST